MEGSSERRSMGRVAIPAGIVGSVMVPVVAYVGVDLIRLLLG